MEQILNQLIPLLIQVVVLIVGVLISLALQKAKGYLDNLKKNGQSNMVSTLAYSVANLAEAQLKGKAGADKFNFAADKLAQLLVTKGVKVSPTEIHAAIETAVAHLPKDLKPIIVEQPVAAGTTAPTDASVATSSSTEVTK